MANTSIEKVLTVFEGIVARDAGVGIKSIDPQKYVEHNPFTADGVLGLREYISQLPPDNHHLALVRAFQDGAYVFTSSSLFQDETAQVVKEDPRGQS